MRIKIKKVISEKNKAILEMRKQRKSICEIGEYFNLSRQRIWQVLEEYGDTGDTGETGLDIPLDK